MRRACAWCLLQVHSMSALHTDWAFKPKPNSVLLHHRKCVSRKSNLTPALAPCPLQAHADWAFNQWYLLNRDNVSFTNGYVCYLNGAAYFPQCESTL